MRILILGGTAFLSAEIARQAARSGHDVTCLARGTSGGPPDGVRWLKADRSAGVEAYREAAGEWDAVVDVVRDPVLAGGALESLSGQARHWTLISSTSVYADTSTPNAAEDAALLDPLPAETPYAPELYGAAKVAIEAATTQFAGGKAHICRAGLIGGPGDGTDRYGYWPARFARNQDPVLLPDIPDSPTQVIDVRDLAAWILTAAERQLVGTFNALGDQVPFGAYIDEARLQAGLLGEVAVADEEWLREHDVAPWAGPDSLPLWLPLDHDGFMARSNAAARGLGLAIRPWQETMRDTLDDERQRGLDRERKAGLSPGTEEHLVAELLASPAEPGGNGS